MNWVRLKLFKKQIKNMNNNDQEEEEEIEY